MRTRQGNDPRKRQRKELQINHSPTNLPNVDVHGILSEEGSPDVGARR